MKQNDFQLGIPGFHYSDLFQPVRLKDLHESFWTYAEQCAPGVKSKFESIGTEAVKPPQESEILIQVAEQLGGFLSELFRVGEQTSTYRDQTLMAQPVFRFKREFLNVRVYKRLEEAPSSDENYETLRQQVEALVHRDGRADRDRELGLAETTVFLMDCDKALKKGELSPQDTARAHRACDPVADGELPARIQVALNEIEEFCVQVFVEPARRTYIRGWASYVRPRKLDFENLVHTLRPDPKLPQLQVAPDAALRPRDGFKLTDPRMSTRQILREIDYCIYCHQREKDSCSKGFPEKDGTYKKNPLGIPLKGCPLDERISEMHMLRKRGELIGALAMIVLDNPMCPGTGHRICNDCMKGCIFQKQDPVNIPENETSVLTDVLSLPYGFEIYGLLTRFNPLNRQRPYALPYNGHNVLVVGLGPAGYTLSHYLANDGFGVIGIDALKIEPLPAEFTGDTDRLPRPIQSFTEIKEELDERLLAGFGGVSEYGITVRWDKNFLKAIYLTLARRKNVQFYGGVRFGGTLTLEDAWEWGFSHVAIATGAGRPTLVPMKNNLARGMRQASDFLMALQLTGAFKRDSLANLQVRLPMIVIGGGLTGVDTATETLAYYPIQVEKVLEQFEHLSAQLGEDTVLNLCDESERLILAEFLEHGRAVREERASAKRENRKPSFIQMCREWGGVSLAYRRRMIDSPAYRLNHEEVEKALEEGIGFIENMTPVEAAKDRFGWIEALVCKNADGELVRLPARSVAVAAGTSPNTIYERELPGTFKLDEQKKFFQKHIARPTGEDTWELEPAATGQAGAFFLSHSHRGRYVSFYGDNHPDYAGNVVKAMASAKHGSKHVSALFGKAIHAAENNEPVPDTFAPLVERFDRDLVPKVVEVRRLTPTIIEVIVKGRQVARKFEPGQFYRLQNYETSAPKHGDKTMAMEALALTGAWVDKEKDLLSMIVLEMGTSSRLCQLLKPGEPVVVMGPTGTPSEIPHNETVCLVGGGLGNAVLLSISRALKENGCRVLYFAGYRNSEDIFMQREIEQATDQMVWAVDRGTAIPTHRPHDLSFVGNIVQAMHAYASGKLGGAPDIDFKSVDRILAIGSDRMMRAVSESRHTILKPFLNPEHVGIGSINSPMQCMMKEVCAQCLQRHVDPDTGQESFVFSCFNQDQLLDHVDFDNLNERLRMNSLEEKLSNLVLNTLYERSPNATL